MAHFSPSYVTLKNLPKHQFQSHINPLLFIYNLESIDKTTEIKTEESKIHKKGRGNTSETKNLSPRNGNIFRIQLDDCFALGGWRLAE